jgi:DNA-binding CsgD family transcriptional regulator
LGRKKGPLLVSPCRLKKEMLLAATRFVKAAPSYSRPAELLDALQSVARNHRQPLYVLGLMFLVPRYSQFEKQRLGRSIFFHPDFPGEDFWPEYQKLAIANGSLTNDYARHQSLPFTLTEAMRALRLTGGDRWLIELLQRFRIRDALYCPFRRWILVFHSGREVLRVDHFDRHVLAWVAGAAVEQVERLVKKQWPFDQRADLTPREIEVLRVRSRGKKNPEAAKEMGVGIETVRTYLKRAKKKLRARDVTEAVAKAMRQGLLPGAGH